VDAAEKKMRGGVAWLTCYELLCKSQCLAYVAGGEGRLGLRGLQYDNRQQRCEHR
jgi:hypothetical protein